GASHAGIVAAVAGRVADALYARLSEQGPSAVDMIFPTWDRDGPHVVRRSLLPVDWKRFAAASNGTAPLVTLPLAELLEGLAQEYIHALLSEAAMWAFAAENEARVAAMVNAKTNIDKMLAELKMRERQVPQDAITTEVV